MEELTFEQQRSIGLYRSVGIDIKKVEDGTVIIAQNRIYNGLLLNQKQLHERARKIFPIEKIRTVVYHLEANTINLEWIVAKMQEFGIKRNDLIKQLAFDKSTLSLLLSGERGLTKSVKATFFYYFLTYELNRDLRKQVE